MALHLPSPPYAPAPEVRRYRWLRVALMTVTGVSALSAIAGGIGLLVSGLGIPESQLDGTPFGNFTMPGLLLAIVVGGSMATATIAAWQRVPWAGDVAMVAGAVMLGWIAVESVMITEGRPLQVTVGVLSLLTIALGYGMRKTVDWHWDPSSRLGK